MRLFPEKHHGGPGEPAPRGGPRPFHRAAPAGAGGGGGAGTSSAALPTPTAWKSRRIGDFLFRGITFGFSLLVIGLVFAIVASLLNQSQQAWGAIGIGGLFGAVWLPGANPPQFGSLPLIAGTLVTSGIAVLIGVPVSVAIAIFLSELAPPWIRGPISIVVELLAAIPSVVYGLWGIFFLAPFLRDTLYPRLQTNWGWTGLFGGNATGYSVLTAGILLSIMIIPTVSALSREVFRAVPVAQREAAYALGATRWEVIRKVVVPYGRTGLFGASILGLARAVGETMAVTMVIGNRNSLFGSLLSPGNTIPSVLANETYEASGLHLSALFALGVILFLVALVINIAARLLILRVLKSSGGAKT